MSVKAKSARVGGWPNPNYGSSSQPRDRHGVVNCAWHHVWWVRHLWASRCLICALRWYDARLSDHPEEWVKIYQPLFWGDNIAFRHVSRYKSWQQWKYCFVAARRIIGARNRQIEFKAVYDRKNQEWQIKYPVWRSLQIRFGFEDRPELDWLFDPEIEARFKALPGTIYLGYPAIRELDAKIGKSLLERTKEHLYRDLSAEQLAHYTAPRKRTPKVVESRASEEPERPISEVIKNYLRKIP